MFQSKSPKPTSVVESRVIVENGETPFPVELGRQFLRQGLHHKQSPEVLGLPCSPLRTTFLVLQEKKRCPLPSSSSRAWPCTHLSQLQDNPGEPCLEGMLKGRSSCLAGSPSRGGHFVACIFWSHQPFPSPLIPLTHIIPV